MIETLDLGKIKWYHIVDPKLDDLKFLEDSFKFHPLDLEVCRKENQRPKIDVYDDYYFIIFHFPVFDRWNHFLKIHEVKVFWSRKYLITIGKTSWIITDLYNKAKDETDIENFRSIGSSDVLLYKILEHLMISTLTMIQKLGEEVDLINRELFNKKAENTIERISMTRRNIISLNTTFKPQLRFFQKIESGEIPGFASNMEEYWGHILDYYQKMWDMIEDYQEMIEGLSKTFDSLQTNKTNEIMRLLTFFSTVLLPLTLVASLYGMNIRLPFQDDPHSFWYLAFVEAVIVALLILFFKRKKWL